jgi:hypothetical protein
LSSTWIASEVALGGYLLVLTFIVIASLVIVRVPDWTVGHDHSELKTLPRFIYVFLAERECLIAMMRVGQMGVCDNTRPPTTVFASAADAPKYSRVRDIPGTKLINSWD